MKFKEGFIKILKFFIGKKLFIQFKSYFLLKKFQNLANPKTFNEKINFRKLYDDNPLIPLCSNKYFVKIYTSSLVGEKHTIPTYWIGKKLTKQIIQYLPSSFAIKTTNSNGPKSYNFVVDKNLLNVKSLLKKFNNGVHEKYGKYSDEVWYDKTENFILAEMLLLEGLSKIIEYKIYCFNYDNKFDFVTRVIKDRNYNKSNSFYDNNWKYLNIGYMKNKLHDEINQPLIHDKIIQIAKVLSKPFKHVRIDFLVQDENIYVGEMTFADTSGFIKFDKPDWDSYLGSKWK
jgi:hypothetical protein